MNRKLTRFEIWFKNHFDCFEAQTLLIIILGVIILWSANFVINLGLDRDKAREDIAISKLMEQR